MSDRILATYSDGAFYPDAPCDLPEDFRVELAVQAASTLAPIVTDNGERRRILGEVVRRMQDNPLPTGASQLTRNELHERR